MPVATLIQDLHYVFQQPHIQPPQMVSTSDLGVIEKLLDTLDPMETLVLWDVDQTLHSPNDAILKPCNEKLFDKLLGGKKVYTDETGKIHYIFREILIHAPHSLVDPKSVDLIKKLQERNMPTIAFTLAPAGKVGEVESFIDWRVNELASFGFDFSPSFPGLSFELPKDPDNEYAPLFHSGVLVTSLHDKGPVLRHFFQALEWRPKRLVIIDDQPKNVQSIVEEFGFEMEVYGFHYTAASLKPSSLNPELGQFQVDHFKKTGEWLSDAEAQREMQKRF
jgi:hypothetical protein